MPSQSSNPFAGIVAFVTGASLTVTEFLTNGSLLLTVIGGCLAVLGGWWAYRTAKIKHGIALLETRQKELEIEKAELQLAEYLNRQNENKA